MLIRDAVHDDDVAVERIVTELWGKDLAMGAVREFDEMFVFNTKSPPHFYVAEIENEVVGYAGFREAWLMPFTYEFIWINVAKAYQGQGIGAALTQKRVERIKELDGSLILLMTQKQRFFEKFDFHRVAMFWSDELLPIQKRMLSGGPGSEDPNYPWILMTLQLRPVQLTKPV